MKFSAYPVTIIAGFLLFLTPAMTQTNKPVPVPPDKKTTARLWYNDVIVEKRHEIMDSILARDVVQDGKNKLIGIEQLKKHIADLHKDHTFSMRGEIVVAEGKKVAALREVTDKTADGRTKVFAYATFFDFDSCGKIVRMKHVHD
jgi:hypothetical protein